MLARSSVFRSRASVAPGIRHVRRLRAHEVRQFRIVPFAGHWGRRAAVAGRDGKTETLGEALLTGLLSRLNLQELVKFTLGKF